MGVTSYGLVDQNGNALGTVGNPLQVTGGGGGTQYTDGQVPPANPVGNAFVFDASGTWKDVGIDQPFPVQIYSGANLLAIDGAGRITLIPNSSVNIAQQGGVATAMASADAQTAANVPLEATAIYNGTTEDRWYGEGSTGNFAGRVSLYGKATNAGDTAIGATAGNLLTAQVSSLNGAVGTKVPMPVSISVPLGTQVDVSASGTNAVVTATMAAVAAKTNYLTGYEITGLPSTALSSGDVTISGLQNTLTAEFAESTTQGGTLIVEFDPPRAATGVNTAVSVSVAALGASSAKVSVNVHGMNI